MMDKELLLEKITEEQILEIIGIPPVKITEKEMWFQTVCHDGDSNKLCYFRDSKSFCCYTNCGYMNLFDFIMHKDNCEFQEAISTVAKIVGYSGRNGIGICASKSKDEKDLDRYLTLRRKKKKDKVEIPIIDEHILEYFDKTIVTDAWLSDGIGVEAMQEFGISYYWLESYIIIPHRDSMGRLIGIRRRSLKKDDEENGCKYMPLILEGITYAHPLGLNLYGLYECKEAIKRHHKVVIVESEKSCLLGKTYYGDESFTVATCGFNISQAQIDLLLELGVNEIILGFDRDYYLPDYEDYDENDPKRKAAQRYADRINSLAAKLSPYFTVYILYDYTGLLDDKDSPFDKGKEVLEELMRQKILYIQEE